jgi:hypothetical protein
MHLPRLARLSQAPRVIGSHRGWYHTYRQPGDASQYTARCPGGPPLQAATAGAQSQIDQDAVIRPGPHSCPFAHRSG